MGEPKINNERRAPATNPRITHLSLVLFFLRFFRLLRFLCLSNDSLAGLSALSFGCGTTVEVSFEVYTGDTTLVLDGTAYASLRGLLRQPLLVHATVDLSPSDLTGVLAL